MGIFSSIKDAFSAEGLAEYWTVPEEAAQISDIVAASADCPQLIYKHSYRCATCLFAKKEVERAAQTISEQVDFHFVDVIKNRPVSNRIVEVLDVRHESPQVLILKNKEVIWHASHSSIKADSILEILEK